ncbi:MAG: hypothetical protein MSM72_06025 [Firmicutes bacterium]|nr:hypothetical protein [Bacillota bacterium]
MASLLAVVMIFSVVGISPAVFAEGAVAPELKANSGEVIIKSGMTNDEVAQILNKALISNYDELDDATKAALQWEYKGYGYTKNGVPSAKKHWGTINGNALVTTVNYGFGKAEYYNRPLKDRGAGNYQVRLAGTTTEATLVWVDKYTSEVVLKAGNDLCILTKDGEALNNASAGSIHYWFTGVGKLYAKSTMPTAPGKYIVTASVRGGDFFAMPKTFTFTIVADPTPEVTPEA